MRYTIWENTPLKWHKFMTYVILPISTLLGISMLVQRIADMNRAGWMWNQTITALNWLDIDYTVIRIILCVIAFLGCLPSRRKWYGPQCAIVLYVLGGLYSLLCVILYSYWETPQSLIVQQFSSSTVCIVAAILNWIYYQKRRSLFSGKSTIVPNSLPKSEAHVSDSHTGGEKDPAPFNGDLLPQQTTQYNEAFVIPTPATDAHNPAKANRLHLAVIALSIICALFAIGCSILWWSTRQSITELQSEKELLSTENNDIKLELRKNEAKIKDYELDIQTLEDENTKLANRLEEVIDEYYFYHHGAVIVTEFGSKYHTYECQYVQGKNYWIYNVELAVYEGYSPCSVCNPPVP